MRYKTIFGVLALTYCLTFQACGASDLHKLHTSLDKAAATLNAAAKTNHSFYESGVYGPVGSEGAIKVRQKAATVIGEANDKLIIALNLAKQLTPASFDQGKLTILATLSEAVAGLKTGNAKIDVVLQASAAVINQAIVLVQALKSADLRYLPEIQNWQIERVQWAV